MKNHLQFYWWKYIAIALVCVIFWTGIFQALAQPKAHQRVNILFLGTELDAGSLRQELEQALPGLTEQDILSVAVDMEYIQDQQLYNTLTARCFDYDLIIIKESDMQENIGQNVFVRLLPELTEQLPNALPYQEQAEELLLTFGYILYDGESENRFSRHYSGNEKCYVFISPESVNFDTLNERGIAGQDGALKLLQYLMENTK